jgi:hypothetical protein
VAVAVTVAVTVVVAVAVAVAERSVRPRRLLKVSLREGGERSQATSQYNYTPTSVEIYRPGPHATALDSSGNRKASLRRSRRGD